jgi:hypothetical protein
VSKCKLQIKRTVRDTDFLMKLMSRETSNQLEMKGNLHRTTETNLIKHLVEVVRTRNMLHIIIKIPRSLTLISQSKTLFLQSHHQLNNMVGRLNSINPIACKPLLTIQLLKRVVRFNN